MDRNAPFLCSELVQLRAGSLRVLANLESIGRQGCLMVADTPIPAGTAITMQCLDCPAGHQQCRKCRFQGRVHSVQCHDFGAEIVVEFGDRKWNAQRWKPRHLVQLP